MSSTFTQITITTNHTTPCIFTKPHGWQSILCVNNVRYRDFIAAGRYETDRLRPRAAGTVPSALFGVGAIHS
jgi:hypothetical protein